MAMPLYNIVFLPVHHLAQLRPCLSEGWCGTSLTATFAQENNCFRWLQNSSSLSMKLLESIQLRRICYDIIGNSLNIVSDF